MPTGNFDINELKRRMQGATQRSSMNSAAAHRPRRGLDAGAGAGRGLRHPHAAQPARDRQRAGAAAALGAGLGQVDGQGGGKGDRRFQSRPEPATEGQVLRCAFPSSTRSAARNWSRSRTNMPKPPRSRCAMSAATVSIPSRSSRRITRFPRTIRKRWPRRAEGDRRTIAEIDQLLAAKEKEILTV
jgi:hypothetical protein